MKNTPGKTVAEHHTEGKITLSHIEQMGVSELRAALGALLGTDPPKRLGQRVLAMAVAYEVQLAEFDDMRRAETALSKLTRKRCDASIRRSTSQLAPGAQILRDWRGSTLIVDVVEGGFVFDGELYPSLSAIATKATGCKRNGPAFFGLRA